MSKRIFVKEIANKKWNELHKFDYEKNTMTVYNQDLETGFTFSFYESDIKDWGYMSIDDAIKKLCNRNMLGKEVENAEVKIESEIEAWAKFAANHSKNARKKEKSENAIANCKKTLTKFYGLSEEDVDWEINFASSCL